MKSLAIRFAFLLLLFSLLTDLSAQGRKDYALLFAVNEYVDPRWQDLVHPISDVKELGRTLSSIYNFEVEIVENPSAEDIDSKLREYARKNYGPTDQLMVMYSGHGVYDDLLKIGYIAPSNSIAQELSKTSYLGYDRLQAYFSNIPCQHILFVSDACYAGSIFKEVAVVADKGTGVNSPSKDIKSSDEYVNAVLGFKSRLCITAGGNEKVPDESKFAKRFTQILEDKDNLLFSHKFGIRSAKDLFTYMNDLGKVNRCPQPYFGMLDGHDAQNDADFLFIPPNKSQAYSAVFRGVGTIGDKLLPELLKGYYSDKGARNINESRSSLGQTTLSLQAAGKEEKILIDVQSNEVAFRSLATKEADVAMSSRPPKNEDLTNLSLTPENEQLIAMDALVIVVNNKNPLVGLNMAQITKIFKGEIKDWAEVEVVLTGAINLYVKDDDFFKEAVLNNGVVNYKAKKMDSDDAISKAVANDPMGIGFLSLSAIGLCKPLRVSVLEGEPGFIPNSRTILAEDYPLARPLFLYVPSNKNSAVNDFVKFIKTSEKARQIISTAGFTPVKPAMESTSCVAVGKNAKEYTDFCHRTSASRFSTTFRFASGTTVLSNKSKADIRRLASILDKPEFYNAQIYVLGFSDDQKMGKLEPMQLSEERAKVIAKELESYGVYAQLIKGFGEAYPYEASTVSAKAKNCRVEIWVGR